ncbi:MAG TPA: hypothetical protein VN921_01335 [Chthoniobacterales bacterium]|nr:hypothetical protein [Chthoniobacterales bacterium]
MSLGSPQEDSTQAIAAGISGVALLNGPGRLRRIVVTAAGTASTTFYDDPAAAQGTVLFVTPAVPPLGMIYELDFPVSNSVWAVGIAGSAALTVNTRP